MHPLELFLLLNSCVLQISVLYILVSTKQKKNKVYADWNIVLYSRLLKSGTELNISETC